MLAGSYAEDKCRQRAQALLKLFPHWSGQFGKIAQLTDDITRCLQIGAATIFFVKMDEWVCGAIRHQAVIELKSYRALNWGRLLADMLNGRRPTLEVLTAEEPAPSCQDLLAEREAKAKAMADQLIADEALQQARKREQAAKKHRHTSRQLLESDQEILETPSSSDSDSYEFTEYGLTAANDADASLQLPDAPTREEKLSAPEAQEAFLRCLMTCPLTKVGLCECNLCLVFLTYYTPQILFSVDINPLFAEAF